MIAEKIKNIKDSIVEICESRKRNPEEIKLIAVSKNFGIEEISEAFQAGIIDFGENKAQELDQKASKISLGINWHFIGTLQRNKARFAVQYADYIHSVNSLQLAAEINKYAARTGKIQKVLLQVKTSSEETKSGIENESELFDLAAYCKQFNNIEAAGLMTLAPLTDNENEIRNSFKKLKQLQAKLYEKGFSMKELSMGMTSDYKIAIEEGATMLRIGSAIFGERDYSTDWRDE
jgi:PLP dependent protein